MIHLDIPYGEVKAHYIDFMKFRKYDMSRQAHSFWVAALVAMAVIWSVSDTVAEGIDAENVPRQCVLDDGIGYGTVKVQACPNTTECPTLLPCSKGEGTCAVWTYKFTWKDAYPAHVALSVSADVSIRSTTPRAHVTPLGEKEPKFGVGKNQFGRRWLRFPTDSPRHEVVIETPAEFARGVAGTAAAKGDRIKEFCLILAPGARLAEPFQPQTQMMMDELDCGTVTRFVDLQGRTISAEASEGCRVTRTKLTNSEGQKVLFANPRTQVTFEGSTLTCYLTSTNDLLCYSAQ